MDGRKIPIFKSLAAKLFYCMTGIVVLTVVGNSVQHYQTFSRYLAEQVTSSTVLRSETTSSQIESQLENWSAQIGTVVPTYNGDAKQYEDVLERFVTSNSDFVAIRVYSSSGSAGKDLNPVADAKTKRLSDPRFEDKSPNAAITTALRESRKIIAARAKNSSTRGKNVEVVSLAKKTGLPLMLVLTRFDAEDKNESLWAAVICWQSSIIKSLPKSAFVDTFVVDSKGSVFSANDMTLLTRQGRFQSEQLLSQVLSGKKISDFVPEYSNSHGRRVIGGYARIPQYGLSVLTEEDIGKAYEELDRNQLKTILWAALFVMIAMAVAYFGAAGTTRSLRSVTDATRRIASGDFDSRIRLSSQDEIGALASSVNAMSSEIVKLMRQNAAKVELEKELETAKMVQSTFFPKKNVLAKNIRATGFYQPATQCGGDLWGHYEVEEDLHLLYIADAMGHGVPAALVTAMAYSVSATIAQLASSERDLLKQPSEFLRHLNKVIFDAMNGTMSMTAFVCLIDTKRGVMTCSNAGHNFPFIIPQKADDDRQQSKRKKGDDNAIAPISMKLRGDPLGMVANVAVEDKEYQIKAGDKLFLFTDGLIECSAPTGEVWGRKHLQAQLTETAALSFDDMKDEVLSRAFSFFAGKALDDDVTVVVAEIPKSWRPQVVGTERPRQATRIPPPVPAPVAAPGKSTAPIALPDLPKEAAPVAKEKDEDLIPAYMEASLAIDEESPADEGGVYIPGLSTYSESASDDNAGVMPVQEFSMRDVSEVNTEDPSAKDGTSRTHQVVQTQPEQEKKPRPKGRYKIKLPTAG